jgi:hypothetical protein
MIYRKLFDWIDSDDSCEATAVTLYSGHDPTTDPEAEQEYIINRVKNLIETGVTIQSIDLTVYQRINEDYQVKVLSDFINVIKDIYKNGDSIETMAIKVSIKEHSWA